MKNEEELLNIARRLCGVAMAYATQVHGKEWLDKPLEEKPEPYQALIAYERQRHLPAFLGAEGK